jgi:hypothetical protein
MYFLPLRVLNEKKKTLPAEIVLECYEVIFYNNIIVLYLKYKNEITTKAAEAKISCDE